jgi:transposase
MILTDAILEQRLFANAGVKPGHRRHAEPDWASVHREMRRKHVTLSILWEEYRAPSRRLSLQPFLRPLRGMGRALAGDDAPGACCGRAAVRRLRWRRRAGGDRPAERGNPQGATLRRRARGVELHFAHASWTQALPDWIDAHVRALEAIGGARRLLVPDNAKTAVIKACLYDPQVNRTYGEMAAHYDTAILPARPRRPKDRRKSRLRCSLSSVGFSAGCGIEFFTAFRR